MPWCSVSILTSGKATDLSPRLLIVRLRLVVTFRLSLTTLVMLWGPLERAEAVSQAVTSHLQFKAEM